MNEDALLQLVDDMLNCRKIGLEKINRLYGTNISVDLSSSWKEVRDSYVSDNNQEENKQEEQAEEITNDGTNENQGVD